MHAVPDDLGLDRTVEQLVRRARRGDEAASESELEQAVRTALIEACEAELGRMDAAASEGADTDDAAGRQAMALTYREGKKALLSQSVEVLRRGVDGEGEAAATSVVLTAERRAELLSPLKR